MAHVYIEDIGKHEGEEVTIKGWLHNRRSSGKIHFLILRDGSGFIQAVMSKAAVGDDLFRAADHLSQETSIVVTGTARADTRAPSGYEIDVKSLEIVGESHDYPITPKEHGVDYLLDRRHLWIRSERQQAILRVRHEIINGVREFLNRRGRRARARAAAARAEGARARHVQARIGPEAVSAHLVRRGGQDAPSQGAADRVGRRFRRA